MRSKRALADTLRSGRKHVTPGLSVVVTPGEPGVARLGLAVKASGAVRRNRIKRRLRAAFRAGASDGVDCVARADDRAASVAFQELVETFRAGSAEVRAD